MMILQTLLSDLPPGWRVTDVYIGANWVLSLIEGNTGVQQAGVAAAPHQLTPDAPFQIGHYPLDKDAEAVARWLDSADATTAAIGLATLNALNQPDEHLLTTTDAADWLSAQSLGRNG